MEKELEGFVTYLLEVKKASKNTIASYKRDLEKLLRYLVSQDIQTIDKVKETNLNSYILFLEREGMSASTVSRSIASMKAFLFYLAKVGVISENQAERIKPPKVDKKVPNILTVKEMESLLEKPDLCNPKGIRDKAMLELIYATGIRVSEIIKLELGHINLKRGYICCENGSNKERIIPIGKSAKSALVFYLEHGRGLLLHNNDNNLLFTNCQGRPLSRQGFWKILKKYAALSGIEQEITPHILRYTFAAHLISSGADLKAVQDMLGNADVSTALVYLYSKESKLKGNYSEVSVPTNSV